MLLGDMRLICISLFLVLLVTWSTTFGDDLKTPSVLIAILARNKAHTLPYFLSYLERLDYPKKRIDLWIRSDRNIDETIDVLTTWLEDERKNYHDVNFDFDKETTRFMDETGISDWSDQRFHHVINLREEALNYARNVWADFIFMLDADVFLTNPNTIKDLVAKNQTVVAPLLKSDGLYSNFWAGMTEEYYYLRTEKYEPILFQQETGCFEVPMIHSAVLIDLRKISSDYLTYNAKNLAQYDGPIDDIITFAIVANKSGVPLFVCNDNAYGFVMIPLKNDEIIVDDLQRLTNIKVEIIEHNNQIALSKNLQPFVTYPVADTLDLDNIYMINLLRRPERRVRMHKLFKELGIWAEITNAVDGRTLDEAVLKNWEVEMMPEYADPYRGRPMTTGEIGCFLSHYVVWNKVIKDGHERVMVLEDDVRFEPFFRQKVNYILAELDNHRIYWDLVYLGRKRLVKEGEPWIKGSKYLVRAAYSYWTLGYMLSASGAKKLVDAMPLKKLIPVDEYLPILSDAHPREDWKAQYPKRDLVVLSVEPLLIYPTHYTGDHGYISDTENSKIVSDNLQMNYSNKREEL